MAMIQVGLCCLAAAFVTSADSRPLGSRERLVITNYWDYVNRVLDTRRHPPAFDIRDSRSRYPSTKEFPFNGFKHLRARDLLKAAQEGITVARRDCRGQSEEAILRQAIANVHLCLEYYPLLARDNDDMRRLFYELERPTTDPALRLFLLERFVPGFVSVSLFSQYLQDRLAQHSADARKFLRGLVDRYSDDPRVHGLAIRACYQRLLLDYQKALLKDSAVQEQVEEGKPVPMPRALLGLPGLELGPAAEGRRRTLDRECGEFAELLDKYLAGGRWPEPVVRVAEETLERLYRELPLEAKTQAQNG